jgi:hypothetical protein
LDLHAVLALADQMPAAQQLLEEFEEYFDLPRKLPLKKQLSQRQSAEL